MARLILILALSVLLACYAEAKIKKCCTTGDCNNAKTGKFKVCALSKQWSVLSILTAFLILCPLLSCFFSRNRSHAPRLRPPPGMLPSASNRPSPPRSAVSGARMPLE